MAPKISTENVAQMLTRAKDDKAITQKQFDELLAGLERKDTLGVLETASKIETVFTDGLAPLEAETAKARKAFSASSFDAKADPTPDKLLSADGRGDDLSAAATNFSTQMTKMSDVKNIVRGLLAGIDKAGLSPADSSRLKAVFDAELVSIATRMRLGGE